MLGENANISELRFGMHVPECGTPTFQDREFSDPDIFPYKTREIAALARQITRKLGSNASKLVIYMYIH